MRNDGCEQSNKINAHERLVGRHVGKMPLGRQGISIITIRK